jgi:hypothetical protein
VFVFGGFGYDANGAFGLLDDVWEYSGGEQHAGRAPTEFRKAIKGYLSGLAARPRRLPEVGQQA